MIRLAQDPFLKLAAVLALGTFFGSLFVQYLVGIEPCPMCVLQRLLYLGSGVLLLLAWWLRAVQWPLVVAAIATSAGAAATALYQGWIASDEALSECGKPGLLENSLFWLADNVSAILFSAEASCLDAAVHRFLGVPMTFWSLLTGSVLVALLLTHLKLRTQHPR